MFGGREISKFPARSVQEGRSTVLARFDVRSGALSNRRQGELGLGRFMAAPILSAALLFAASVGGNSPAQAQNCTGVGQDGFDQCINGAIQPGANDSVDITIGGTAGNVAVNSDLTLAGVADGIQLNLVAGSGSGGVYVNNGATLTIDAGANVDFTGHTNLYIVTASGRTGAMQMTGGALSFSNPNLTNNTFSIFSVGYGGVASFAQSGGDVFVEQSPFQLGVAGGTGTYDLSGGSFSMTTGISTITIGNNGGTGTMNVTGNAQFKTDTGAGANLSVGVGGATGLIMQDGAASLVAINTVNTQARLGAGSGAQGTYDLRAGTFNLSGTPGIVFGVDAGATGSFLQSGGTFTAAAESPVVIGEDGTGLYALTGGAATMTGGLQLAAGSGSGTVNQTGGALSIGGAGLAFGTGVGTYNLNGGTLTLDAITGGDAMHSTLNLGGGTLIAATGFTADATFATNLTATSTIAVNATDTLIWTGAISGAGALAKTGTGTLTLTGTNTYTGGTTVNAGTLDVAGSLASTVAVDGGQLAGTGMIGGLTVTSGGTLAPGNSIGTMTVAGNMTFGAGSILETEIAGNGTSDLLAVGGTATLQGGTVSVIALDPETSYQTGQTYTILTAAGGVAGQFAGSTSQSAFITPTLGYDSDSVQLKIAVGQTDPADPPADPSDPVDPGLFSQVAETQNQMQSASALDGLTQSGDALAVYNQILMLSAPEARAAFDLASGEIHATGQHVINQTFALFSGTLQQHGGNPGTGTAVAPLAYASPSLTGTGISAIDGAAPLTAAPSASAWLAPLGGRGEIAADGNAARLDWWAAGIAGGYERMIDFAGGEAHAGFGFGYLRSHGAVPARLSTTTADGFHAGAYGGWANGPWSVEGSLAYGASAVSSERRIVFSGLDRTAGTSYLSHTIGISGEAAYAFELATGTTLSPLFTLDAAWSGHGGFTETGAGALNLTGAAENWAGLDTGLGVALEHVVLTERGAVTLDGRVVWEHAFGDVVPSQALAFAGSPTAVTVEGPDSGRDRLALGLGVAFEMTDALTVRAGYTGLFSASQRSHAASIGLSGEF